jgi:hypothetical protein
MKRLLRASQILLKLGGGLAIIRYRLLVRRGIGALRRLLLPEVGLGLSSNYRVLLRLLRRVGASLAMILGRTRVRQWSSWEWTACLYLLGRSNRKPLIGKKGHNT